MDNNLITKEQIEANEGLAKTHFLNDNARRVNKSLGDMAGLTGLGFHIIEVEPGHVTTEFHRHYFEDECVYILEGAARARIGDQVFQVKAGDFIGYPAGGEAHDIYNDSDRTLKCIVVGQRLAHDVADYPEKNRRIFRNGGMPWDLAALDQLEHPNAGQKS